MLHRLAGITLGILFILIYTGNVDWFSNFNQSVSEALGSDLEISYYTGGGVVSKEGVIYLFLPAIFSVFFLLFPSLSARLFSPKDMYNQPMLSRGFWFIPGYFMALVALGLLYVYE